MSSPKAAQSPAGNSSAPAAAEDIHIVSQTLVVFAEGKNSMLLKYSYDYPATATGYPALQGTLALPAVL